MPAAAKKPAEVPPLAVDDPRSKLAAAISAHTEAKQTVELKLQAIRRSLDGIEAAETNLEKSKKAVAKAREIDAKTAATNLDRGANPVSPWHTRQAISAVETAETTLEVADAAHKRLKGELAGLEDDVVEASNGIVVAIKELSRPLVEQLMTELRLARRRTAIITRVLSELLSDDPRTLPRFHDTMRDFKAADARAVPFAEIKAEAERLLWGVSDEDRAVALAAAKEMKAALVEMQTNAAAVTSLPKV